SKMRAVGSPSNRVTPRSLDIIDIKDILLPGAHNLENVCAAVMAAILAGVSKKNIVSVLKTFKGLPHRLELVREVGGVRYFDDSFSTTPETAIAAIKAFKSPEILILGGLSKGSDFTDLGRVISEAKNIKAIIGIGVEWKRIKQRIMNNESRIMVIEGAKDMKMIVAEAAKVAQSGDVVLLSPACASFDMFKNYKDRGEQFKREVRRLH
ncbi:MAG: cyanophycin synthetase, partial [bacterium]|nr:cyanophycin synthetase [bacterium]